jgi:hypothetical protein
MPSDDPQDMSPTTGPAEGVPVTTGGAMARARRRRLIVLVALAVLLAALSYVAYYYTQNRRLPIPTVIAGSQALTPPQFLFAFSGTGAQAMTRPTGIVVIGDRVYVTDFALRTIRVYTRTGDFLFDFGNIKDGKNTHLDSPVHMAVSKAGEIWVTDRSLKGVYIFDADGNYLRKFVANGDPSFEWSPLAIAFSADGNLFISDVGDSDNHRILAFAPDGLLLAEWGHTEQIASAGDSPGSFLFPNGLAVRARAPTLSCSSPTATTAASRSSRPTARSCGSSTHPARLAVSRSTPRAASTWWTRCRTASTSTPTRAPCWPPSARTARDRVSSTSRTTSSSTVPDGS